MIIARDIGTGCLTVEGGFDGVVMCRGVGLSFGWWSWRGGRGRLLSVKSTLASERKLYREKGFKFQVFTTLGIRI